eukprot:CAMPEP_0201495816 /NCGR_PEP_ID=MMETSP0151_2-20130828/56216_1 /ASSEMBLY_ACC=CAM_ASM_000257 /TAXON_ID=200890 /ORGANISM="Paramoeba atlantica, Strain 621/1 / CCAP 1560/9" /LENGTH=86 /DNA_ID=CAMNT_0047885129 /DNA_START=133 /DNA_END=393 /DNA_ORIENTATION=-
MEMLSGTRNQLWAYGKQEPVTHASILLPTARVQRDCAVGEHTLYLARHHISLCKDVPHLQLILSAPTTEHPAGFRDIGEQHERVLV